MKVIRCHACSRFFDEELILWIVPTGAVGREEGSVGALGPFDEVSEPRPGAVPYCPTCLANANDRGTHGVSLPGDVYRALVEDLLVGVYLIQDDRLMYVNRRFGQIFGHSRDEVLRLWSALDVIADSDRARVAETLRGKDGEFVATDGRHHIGGAIAVPQDGGRATSARSPAA